MPRRGPKHLADIRVQATGEVARKITDARRREQDEKIARLRETRLAMEAGKLTEPKLDPQ